MGIEALNFVRRIEPFANAMPCEPLEVDFEYAGYRLRGRLKSVSERGQVHIRYARQRVKDLLAAWIYHLAYCRAAATDCPPKSYLICKGSAVLFEPVAEPGRILEMLLRLFQHGILEPIHFFPKSSYEYAECVLRKSVPETIALAKAHQKWEGSTFAKMGPGESRDPYVELCFRHLDALDEDFKKTALDVFGPLLASSKEISI
jgi:exodeoxyribonuclease V gamma subunit